MQWERRAVQALLVSLLICGSTCVLAWESEAQDEHTTSDMVESESTHSGSNAENERKSRPHLLTDLPEALDGVSASLRVLRGGSEDVMYAGKSVDAIVDVVNNATATVSLRKLAGSINSKHDFNTFMHNFTAIQLSNAHVAPNSHRAVEYTFTPNIYLQPTEYTVAITAFYSDGKSEFSTTAFNSTVTILEDKGSLDLANVFIVFVLLSCALSFAYFAIEHQLRRRNKPTIARRIATVSKQRKERKADAAAAAATRARTNGESDTKPSAANDPSFLNGTSIQLEQIGKQEDKKAKKQRSPKNRRAEKR